MRTFASDRRAAVAARIDAAADRLAETIDACAHVSVVVDRDVLREHAAYVLGIEGAAHLESGDIGGNR